MKTVRFETPDAVFSFIVDDVIGVLDGHASEDGANELIEFLVVQLGDVIEIPQEKKSFLYLIPGSPCVKQGQCAL